MGSLWLLMVLILLFCPVRFTAEAEVCAGASFRITVTYLFLRKELRYTAGADSGKLTLQNEHTGKSKQLFAAGFSSGSWKRLMRAFMRGRAARHFLLRHVRLHALRSHLLLRTGDAARTAVITGMLRSGLQLLPKNRNGQVHLVITPDFFREHSHLAFRCILSIRAGHIILTLLMLLPEMLQGRAQLTEEAA